MEKTYSRKGEKEGRRGGDAKRRQGGQERRQRGLGFPRPQKIAGFTQPRRPRPRKYCPRKNKNARLSPKPAPILTHPAPPRLLHTSVLLPPKNPAGTRRRQATQPSPRASSRARPPAPSRRAAPGLGPPRAGTPASLSAARRATGDFGRPLAPLRPKTSKVRASAQRARFLGVCRVDALASMIPRQCFEKPAAARAPRVARAQRLVRPRTRLKHVNHAGSCRCAPTRGPTHQPRRSQPLRAPG